MAVGVSMRSTVPGWVMHCGSGRRLRRATGGAVMLLLSVVASLLLAGCIKPLVNYEARVHVVQPGETLSKIAARYGLDYHQLARWNGIADPDQIHVGQRLRLTPASSGRRPARRASRAPTRSAVTRTAPSSPPPRWQWPTEGRVISRFGSDKGIPSGISISGHLGQPIRAAASGRVVYAGNGLIGYGNLIIIRHNNTYLTAYGDNRRLLVHQGDHVTRGQKIAEMGLGPGSTPLLHFEIRRHGKPVDPLDYLSAPGG